MLPHADRRERGGRTKRRPSLPKRAASNRRDHAKIVPPAQRRGNGRQTSAISGRLFAAAARIRRFALSDPLEMAVRSAFQHDFPALPVQEPRNRAPRDDRADGTHRDAGPPRRLHERLDAILRHACTGSRNHPRRRSTSPVRRCRARPDPCAASESGTDGRSITADTPDTPQSLARSPARPSDTSIAALAWSRTISARATRGCGTR